MDPQCHTHRLATIPVPCPRYLPLHNASPIRCEFLSRKIRWAKRSSSPARAPVEDDATVGVLEVEVVAEVVAVVAVGSVLVLPWNR